MKRHILIPLCLLCLLFGATACSDDGNDSSEPTPDGDTPQEDGDENEDGDEDGDSDGDSDGDLEDDAEESFPDSLEITFTREDAGDPVSDEEISAFTRKVMAFLKTVHYFDYVLYTTHGVDASTGMKDWQFWYNEHFRKDGDLVTFYHPENLNDGGHNLHIPFSRVLGDVLAAGMLLSDETVNLAAEKLCKGMSASMLGMVHDENDPVPHIMSRNVVAFNHEFLTHDGKRKAVDYSGWFSTYERWNCDRFPIENNPYWGKVWVTNLRSKDDVPHIFRLIPVLRYAAQQSKTESVREACGETLTLLEAFVKDIVDSDYRIRAKDKDGNLFYPGFTDDEELNDQQGDLASFIHYRDLIPEGECNARRGAELIGYHEAILEDCGRGEPNSYDILSFNINSYNKRICRYFHLAHVANALINRDNAAAEQLLDGLLERMIQEKETSEANMQTEPDNWWRDVALYLVQSHVYGFPLQSEEVRVIHHYFDKAVDEHLSWPYWNPWDASVPEGDLGGYRPPSCKTLESGERSCWMGVEDMAQLFENCWSPFVNPAGQKLVDCDIVRDPTAWEALETN